MFEILPFNRDVWNFKVSLPLISLFCQSVPKCRLPKNPASPRGKPRGKDLRFYHSTNRSVPSAFGRMLSAPTVGVCIQPAAAKIPRFSLSIVTGRVREPTYWYRPGAAIKRGRLRCGGSSPPHQQTSLFTGRLYFGSRFLSIPFGCLILPKLASFKLHKFICFAKITHKTTLTENYA